METPIAYIPIDRRLALAEGHGLPQRTEGAALFADISGFTPLTEMLARQLGARRGAEELTRQLNRVYDALITELHRYGGSVIGFSGDAITCWLDGDGGQRGTMAALAMQTAMEQFADLHFGDETVSLALKTAVVTGPVRRFIAGDPNYMLIDVLAGHTLQRLATAEHQADKGEVILDEKTAVSLQSHLQISDWRTDPESQERFAAITAFQAIVPEQPWPTMPAEGLREEQARSWLLTAVYRRLQGGQGNFLAELRPAAALFMRFDGIDYDNDEDAPQKLDAFVRRVENILGRYEGSLLQLTIGDKGSYLYAAMGAPIAHEDNVDRLLRVSLELQSLSEELGFLEPLQIGVTYGRMYVGAYGGNARHTYGVLGDAVNLSARLMQAAAPGQILVNDEAFGLASDAFIWEKLEAIPIKGKSEPIVPNRLIGIKMPRARHSLEALFPQPPVGRHEILNLLTQRLTWLAENGNGQVIRLIGEAGMGKSHVMAQFTRQALAQNITVALGMCQSLTQNTAYRPWREIFYSLLDLDDEDESQAIAQLTTFLQNHHPNWLLRLPLLGDLLDLPIPDNPATAALESNLRQDSLFSLLVEMVQYWARERPLILIIENAHWMDEASEKLTQIMAKQAASTAPMLLFLIHRPELIGDAPPLPELVELPYFTALVLEEMADEEVVDLIEHQLHQPASPLLLKIVQTLTRCNPFFIHELIAAMRQSQQIVRENGRWQVSPALLSLLRRADFVTQVEGEWQIKANVDLSTVKLGLPDSIHGLVLSQLDRLPENHKLTLKVSSVLGYYIDLILVTEVHPEAKGVDEIEAEAAYMEAEEVVHQEMPERKIYAFRHQTTQEVAYQTLLHSQRRQLHQAVSEALAAQQPDATTQIAHHAYLGEVWPLALQYNLRAGEQARRLQVMQQSIDFYQKALDCAQALPDAETADQRKKTHLALGELLINTEQYDAADTHLATALAIAQTQGDWEAEARCCRWYGRSHELRGEYPPALEWLEKGFVSLNGRTSLEEAELLGNAALINIRQGNYDQAVTHSQRGLAVGEALGDTAVQARAYRNLGIVDRRRGNSQFALENFQKSLDLCVHLEDIYGQAMSHNLIANAYFMRGEWSSSDFHYRRSLEMFTQIGNAYNQILVNNNLGGIALKQGRLDAALAYYQRALRLLEQIGGSLWVFGALYMNLGHVYVALEELDLASSNLHLARDYFDRAQLRDLLPELFGLFAEVAWHQTDLDAATNYAQQSLDLARELSMPREEGHNLRIMGEIVRAKGALAEAQQYFEDSYHLLHGSGDEYEAAKTLFSLAQLYTAQNQIADAATALDQCEEIFGRLDASLDMDKILQLRQEL